MNATSLRSMLIANQMLTFAPRPSTLFDADRLATAKLPELRDALTNNPQHADQLKLLSRQMKSDVAATLNLFARFPQNVQSAHQTAMKVAMTCMLLGTVDAAIYHVTQQDPLKIAVTNGPVAGNFVEQLNHLRHSMQHISPDVANIASLHQSVEKATREGSAFFSLAMIKAASDGYLAGYTSAREQLKSI